MRDGGTAGAVSIVELRAETGLIAGIHALGESGVAFHGVRMALFHFRLFMLLRELLCRIN